MTKIILMGGLHVWKYVVINAYLAAFKAIDEMASSSSPRIHDML